MSNDISNTDNIIDSLDVIQRIDELKSTEQRDEDEQDELTALEALAEEASGYAPDWAYGEALIRDSYFKEYAMELAADTGAIYRSAAWPNTCIDWDQAARQLQMDYTSVEFGGVTYWVR